MNNSNFRLMFSLYFIIFGIVLTLLGTFIGYKIQMVNVQSTIEKDAQETGYIKKILTLKPEIDRLDSLVLALSTNKTLSSFIINSTDKELKDDTKNLFYAMTMSDKFIMQARYINKGGKEEIRIERQNVSNLPVIVEDSMLQDKRNRDYFQVVSKMNNEKIWHSKIDLNIEHGKTEVPFRPTIRVASPVFINEKFKGMVIINVLVNDLISNIRKSSQFEHYIVDKEGNFIIHNNDKFSWSKYINANINIFDTFPVEAAEILSGKVKGENFYALKLDDVLQNDDDAILILKPKAEFREYITKSNYKAAALVIFLSILISIPLALYASAIPSKLQKALLKSNTELKRFTNIIDKYVITATTKTNSVITSVSSAFEDASGYSKEELIGKKMNIIRHEDTSNKVFDGLWNTISRGKEWVGDIKNKKKNKDIYWLRQTVVPIKDENEKIISFMSIGIDVTAKKELERISTVDKLTNVYNRRKLDEFANIELKRAVRYQNSLSFIMIDIDHFKSINDTYGHQVGDYTLKTVAEILSKNIRSEDILGRYGGEEFLLICPQTDSSSAETLAEHLRKIIGEYTFENIEKLAVSLGVSELNSNDTVDTLLHRADKALYDAKKSGRNRVCLASN